METVELRVHGVHGTSPGAMLGVGDGEVGQVAGDGLTGLYRVKDGVLPYRSLEGTGVSVEAYSWGALTSGVQGFFGWVRRVLWLLLLPFALINLAYWARLELGRDTGQARWGARAVRVSGLLLTVFLVLTPCVVAIDLVAWQCYRYGVPGCSQLPGQLDFLAALDPGQRIAVATVVPMVAVALLWWLSKASLARYESVVDPLDKPPAVSLTQILLHPKLWNGTARTLRLQRYHLTAGVATVIAFTGAHMLRVEHARLQNGWALLLWVTFALSLALLLVSTLAVTITHHDDVEPVAPTRRRLPGPVADTAVFAAAIGVYVVHLVALSMSHRIPGTTSEDYDYTARNIWLIAVFVGLTVLHLSVFTGGRMKAGWAVLIVFGTLAVVALITVLTLTGEYDADDAWQIVLAVGVAVVFWLLLARWQYTRSPAENHDKAWRGAGASVLMATAAWIALLFTTSIVIASASWLNGPTHGVGDLVSQVEGRDVAPMTLGLGSSQSTTEFRATGEVTLRGARITVDASGARVTSGTIEMKGLSLAVAPVRARQDDFTEGRGRTLVPRQSTLVVPTRTLLLSDSCLQRGRARCTAEDTQFHSAGVLTLPLTATGVPLVLSVGKGVALDPSDAPEVPLAVPQVLIWMPIGQLVWLLLVVIAVLAALVVFGRRVAPSLGVLFEPGHAPDDQVPVRDRPRCLQARRGAALAHRAETLLDIVGAITSPVALALVVASMSGLPPWELPHAGWTRNVATASMWLVVGMSAGLILLGSQIRRSDRTRKAVGVIWDLTTFWPRAAHPLAPPCYAERVVPELHIRTRWVLDKPDRDDADVKQNQVIVSGHSQGSLIVLAMVSRLNPVHLERVRMITYGSQVRALYGRVFPRVFGPAAIGYEPTPGQPSLRDAFPDVPRAPGVTPGPPVPPVDTFRDRLEGAGGQWVNLFRRTDPLGWRVFSDSDSDRDVPVPEVPRRGMGDPGPVVMGHSGYQHTLAYRRQMSAWTPEHLVPDPPGTQDLTTLPPL